MQLDQSFTLPFARAAVWPAFADVPTLVSSMPGAALQGETRAVEGGADLDLIFTVKLGLITGAFQGRGAIRRDDAAMCGAFSGSGADRKSGSRVKGEAKFALVETAPAETRVDVAVDYSLTGALAQFSRAAIVKELAGAMTRDFAANLRNRIAQSQPAGAAPGGASAGANATMATARESVAAAPSDAPLDAGRLFRRVLWARITGWFGRVS